MAAQPGDPGHEDTQQGHSWQQLPGDPGHEVTPEEQVLWQQLPGDPGHETSDSVT